MRMPVTVAFLDSLQRQATEEVAFYPRAALERALMRGEIRTSFENGEPCGYLWHGPIRPFRDVVIYQAVVHYDLRRRHHGFTMLASLAADALAGTASAVRCRCRSSIPANDFWRAAGFVCIDTQPGGRRRGADVNVWRMPVLVGAFDDIGVTPSTKASSTALYLPGTHGSRWNRHGRAVAARSGEGIA